MTHAAAFVFRLKACEGSLNKRFHGATQGTRTLDLRITNAPLYQLS